MINLNPRYLTRYQQHAYHPIYFSSEWKEWFVIHERWFFDFNHLRKKDSRYQLVRGFRPKACKIEVAPEREVHCFVWNNESTFWRSEDDDQPQWWGNFEDGLRELRELYRWHRHKYDQEGLQLFYEHIKGLKVFEQVDDLDKEYFVNMLGGMDFWYKAVDEKTYYQALHLGCHNWWMSHQPDKEDSNLEKYINNFIGIHFS